MRRNGALASSGALSAPQRKTCSPPISSASDQPFPARHLIRFDVAADALSLKLALRAGDVLTFRENDADRVIGGGAQFARSIPGPAHAIAWSACPTSGRPQQRYIGDVSSCCARRREFLDEPVGGGVGAAAAPALRERGEAVSASARNACEALPLDLFFFSARFHCTSTDESVSSSSELR